MASTMVIELLAYQLTINLIKHISSPCNMFCSTLSSGKLVFYLLPIFFMCKLRRSI